MSKYNKVIQGRPIGSKQTMKVIVDVYDVLNAFEVHCHATAHAIKKLLMAGKRGSKSARQDLQEAIQAIERAIGNCDMGLSGQPQEESAANFNPT